MTLARHPIGSTIHFPIKEVKLPQPIHYPVMLHKKNGGWKDFYIGYVVTHLDIHDWCEANGYKLVTLHRGMRPAHPNEFTDLF